MPTCTCASSPVVSARSDGMGERPVRLAVIMPHDCPPRNSHLPRFRSTQYRRKRLVCGLEVTKTLAASLPLKSPSRYARTLFSPYLPLTFRLKREYWPVARYSVRWPATVLLNGMAQKLVAVTLPVLVVRKMFSKSTNPPGVNSVPPMRNDNGESFGLSSGASEGGRALGLPTATRVLLRPAFTGRGGAAVGRWAAQTSSSPPYVLRGSFT